MQRLLILLVLVGVGTLDGLAQPTAARTNEFQTGVSALRLPGSDQTGWFVRQGYTRWLQPRLGLSLSGGVGTTAYRPRDLTDAADVDRMFQRHVGFISLGLTEVLLRSARHELRVGTNVLAVRSRTMAVDSVYRGLGSTREDLFVSWRYEQFWRAGIQATVGYHWHPAPRWGLGLEGTASLWKKGPPAYTLGLVGSYRFGLNRYTLGAEGPGQPWRIGIRTGAGLSNVISIDDDRSAVGYHLGVFAERTFAADPRWLLRTELSYVRKGGRIDFVPNPLYLHLHYLDVPLLFSREIRPKLSLGVGGQLSILLAKDAQLLNRTLQVSGRTPAEFGLLASLAYQPTPRVGVDLRHTQGTFNIATTGRWTNRVTQLSLNYRVK